MDPEREVLDERVEDDRGDEGCCMRVGCTVSAQRGEEGGGRNGEEYAPGSR